MRYDARLIIRETGVKPKWPTLLDLYRSQVRGDFWELPCISVQWQKWLGLVWSDLPVGPILLGEIKTTRIYIFWHTTEYMHCSPKLHQWTTSWPTYLYNSTLVLSSALSNTLMHFYHPRANLISNATFNILCSRNWELSTCSWSKVKPSYPV